MKRAANDVEAGRVSGGAAKKECNSFFPGSAAAVSRFLPRTSSPPDLKEAGRRAWFNRSGETPGPAEAVPSSQEQGA